MAGRVHVHAVQLRVADLNYSGHVDNVSILRMMDEARAGWLGLVGRPGTGLLSTADPALGHLVASQSIEYRRELWYRAEPSPVSWWVCHLGGSSMVLAGEVRQAAGDPVAVLCEATVIVTDLATGRPRPIPDQIRATLAGYLGEPVPLRARPGRHEDTPGPGPGTGTLPRTGA